MARMVKVIAGERLRGVVRLRVERMRMSRNGILFVFSCGMLMADVRYTLRCEIVTNDMMLTQNGALRDATKDCTSDIFQTAERQMSRSGRMTQIVEYADETTILIDHVKKTWTRNSASQTEAAARASMEQLKQMGVKLKMSSEKIVEKREIAGYEAKGLANLLEMSFNFPGMDQGMSSTVRIEFWLSETAPGSKAILEWSAKQKSLGAGSQNSPTLRIMNQFLAAVPGGEQLLRESGNLVGQLMEMNMKMESKGMGNAADMRMTLRAEKFSTEAIPASEFEIPDGYTEVK